MPRYLRGGLLATLAALTIGCEADITIGITDAPIDDATSVTVRFTGVNLGTSDGNVESITLSPAVSLDLLTLQGSSVSNLLSNHSIEDQAYTYVELVVDADSNELDSFVEFSDGRQQSIVLEDSGNSLRSSTSFTLGERESISFVIDFDLRKSLNPGATSTDDYILRPHLRLLRDGEYGHLTGTVDNALINDSDCNNDVAADTGSAVYVFAGLTAVTDDIGSAGEPISSGLVKLNADSGVYEFAVGFLPAGGYTAAFTCNASFDAPDSDDADVVFSAAESITIALDETLDITLNGSDTVLNAGGTATSETQ